MPRGVYNRRNNKRTSPAPSHGIVLASPEVINVVPATMFDQSGWFKKLNVTEQKTVQDETLGLAQAMLSYGRSKLAIGEHLTKLQSILEPHNAFGNFLRNFHFSKRTAYNYIRGFANAKARLPEVVLQAAMAKGVDIIGETDAKPLGRYTAAVEKLPPPTNPTPEQAVTWLNQVEQVRKDTTSQQPVTLEAAEVAPGDPATMLKECYRFVALRYRRLPQNHKARQKWVNSLVGMVLTELGVGNPVTVHPIAIPQEFRAQRGRPRIVQAPAVA